MLILSLLMIGTSVLWRGSALRPPSRSALSHGRQLSRLSDARMNIYSLSLEELTVILRSWQQPAFRSKQVREWIYDKGVLGRSDQLYGLRTHPHRLPTHG